MYRINRENPLVKTLNNLVNQLSPQIEEETKNKISNR